MAEMKQMIELRPCGHPVQASLYFLMSDGRIAFYCMPCLFEKIGMRPNEILTVEQFVKKYGNQGGKR